MFVWSWSLYMEVKCAALADLLAIVPATADVMSRLASGRADDLVTALALCARGPVVAAPAMHPRMWEHPATQRNVAQIAAQNRVTLVGPPSGEVASGEVDVKALTDCKCKFQRALVVRLIKPSRNTRPIVYTTAPSSRSS